MRTLSHITGKYPPPATHMPMMAAICGMPIADITALLRNTRPKSSVSGDVFLQREKHAGGVDQVDGWDAVFDRDVLGADDFFGSHREKRAGFYGSVVHDQHDESCVGV